MAVSNPSAPSPPAGPPAREEPFTTGEMARLSNNTLRTVRFYEEAGILQPIRRTEGGHRLYAQRELDRLLLVTDMRAAGMSLEEIRELLETKQRATSGGEAARNATATLEGHLEGLRGRIEMLMRLYQDLAQTVEAAAGCMGCTEGGNAESTSRGADAVVAPQIPLFPSRCGECGKMRQRGPLPRGMRILWSVDAAEAGEQGTAPSSEEG